MSSFRGFVALGSAKEIHFEEDNRSLCDQQMIILMDGPVVRCLLTFATGFTSAAPSTTVMNWCVLVNIFRMRSLVSLLSFAVFFLPDADDNVFLSVTSLPNACNGSCTNLELPVLSELAHYASPLRQLVISLSNGEHVNALGFRANNVDKGHEYNAPSRC